MATSGLWLLCHLARIVPAAGVYASTSMLSFRLQGADEGLHITAWLILVISAGLLALTSHRAFSGARVGRIAAALAILSLPRFLNEPRSQAEDWSVVQERLKSVITDYLRNASIVALVLVVGFPAPPKIASDRDFHWLEKQSNQRSQNLNIRSNSWSSTSSKSLSEIIIGPRVADWLLEASEHIKYMGPSSRASSRSSGASDISLQSEPDRVDAGKARWIQSQTRIAKEGSRE